MTYNVLGAAALNYDPCRYGTSRLLFRGPKRRLDAPYVAFFGSTETYGKFIQAPYPDLVESDIGVNCVNFGISNAGIDVFLNDTMVLEAASGSVVSVLQVIGAHNLSNRFYTVHPRRNDRFLSASGLLKSIYPEVDFSEFHFTRHMLNILHRVSGARFAVLRSELQTAWTARMKLLLRRMDGKVVLLWFANHAPQDGDDLPDNLSDRSDPLFVTRSMLNEVKAHVAGYVEVAASPQALHAGTEGMIFREMETMAARKIMGPKAHGEAAIQLGAVLHNLM